MTRKQLEEERDRLIKEFITEGMDYQDHNLLCATYFFNAAVALMEEHRVKPLRDALERIIKAHESIKLAQAKQYTQDYYEDIKRDGFKYDVSVVATLPIFNCANEALAKVEDLDGQ